MKKILIVCAMILFVSCGSSSPSVSSSGAVTTNTVANGDFGCMPSWVIEVPLNTFSYSGNGRDYNSAVLRAENVARTQMAAAEEAYVEGLIKDVMVDSGVPENDANYFSAAFKSVVDGKVEGFRVLKRQPCKTDDGRVDVYVLTTFDFEALAKKYEAKRKALLAQKQLEAAENALEDLDDEIAKLRARKAAEDI
tara:strand:- start:3676 stop:4257 length:582 start_codon:yes stop_codon:yes gene_type:complete